MSTSNELDRVLRNVASGMSTQKDANYLVEILSKHQDTGDKIILTISVLGLLAMFAEWCFRGL